MAPGVGVTEAVEVGVPVPGIIVGVVEGVIVAVAPVDVDVQDGVTVGTAV